MEPEDGDVGACRLARRHQGPENADGDIDVAAEGTSAEYQSGPQGDGVGGVGGDGGEASKEQRRKRNEAASAGNGIHGSGQERGGENQRRIEQAAVSNRQ